MNSHAASAAAGACASPGLRRRVASVNSTLSGSEYGRGGEPTASGYLGHGDRIVVVGGISNSTVDLTGDGNDLQPSYSWGQPEMQMLVLELSTLTWCFLELELRSWTVAV